MKGNDTVNVKWTQFGEEQKQVRKTFDPSPESIGCPGNGRQRLNEPESSGDASADLLESNHQLESRIQEIWPSGSEGGAKSTLSLPLVISVFPIHRTAKCPSCAGMSLIGSPGQRDGSASATAENRPRVFRESYVGRTFQSPYL